MRDAIITAIFGGLHADHKPRSCDLSHAIFWRISTSRWYLLAACALVGAEALTAVAGASSLLLAFGALLAPGLTLSCLLPSALRSSALVRVTAAAAMSLSAVSLALVTIATLGIPLTGVTVRLALVGLVAAGAFAQRWVDRSEPPRTAPVPRQSGGRPDGALDLVLLASILGVAWLLAWRVVGTLPVPGDDWAKYLLYADEIRNQGKLLLQNELWMGGRPFSEDPGVPALEGAALLMSGADAGALARVILLLQLSGIAIVFATVRAQLGRSAAVAAALLLAIVPATQNILGWHGLANVGALVVFSLVLAQLGGWLSRDWDRPSEVGLALTILGTGLAHRFTALFLVGTLAAVLLAALALRERRALLAGAVRTLAIMIPLGAVAALDLRQRAADAGGTLPYTSYLGTKVDLALAARDLTPVLIAVAAASALWLLASRRLPRVAWPALALALVSCTLGVGWLVHLPLYYSRIVFFLPLPLAILAGAGVAAVAAGLAPGVAMARRGGARRIAMLGILGAAAGAAVGVVGASAWKQAEEVRRYYAFADADSLTGLDQLAAALRPGEIVATDRCWSFLATWLLHTRTYPALEEQDIQPKAELEVARAAAAILRGSDRGRQLMRELPVRYAVLDPNCPVSGRRFFPPGRPVYASERLAIVALDPGRANPRDPAAPRR